ncbi:hypothetical protein J6590_081586 [Homalodisca vitripennis]|nr:hypothetical protein J6590_081586 [Homalodisca vitripennis]
MVMRRVIPASWITDVIRNFQDERDSAFRKANRNNSPADLVMYKRPRKRAKQQFDIGKVNSDKPIAIDINIINNYVVDIPIDLSGARAYINELSVAPLNRAEHQFTFAPLNRAEHQFTFAPLNRAEHQFFAPLNRA